MERCGWGKVFYRLVRRAVALQLSLGGENFGTESKSVQISLGSTIPTFELSFDPYLTAVNRRHVRVLEFHPSKHISCIPQRTSGQKSFLPFPYNVALWSTHFTFRCISLLDDHDPTSTESQRCFTVLQDDVRAKPDVTHLCSNSG